MKKSFYIDYPQAHMDGQAHRYCCAICLQETTKINGLLEGHLPDCSYRLALEKAGYECEVSTNQPQLNTTDEED